MNEETFYYGMANIPGERRRFVRIDTNFVISYYVYPGDVDKIDMTLTRNVSVGGICFTTDKHFPQGTILHITLRLPKISKHLEALGEVVYVMQEKNRKLLFDIGVKFIQAKEEDLFKLENIIKRCASERKKIHFTTRERKKDEGN